MLKNPTLLTETLAALRGGQRRATDLLTHSFGRISDLDDGRVHTALFTDTAMAQAEACDRLLDAGAPTGALGGLPIAIKALFDVDSRITHAGSRVLADSRPASEDAIAVARLRHAGAIFTGHTNMTEFAYSGLGLNPHYGTPPNPFAADRVPGGSSSGSAVAVATGMASAALGTDTGGSVRVPAAFCGLVGFKPSQYRVPLGGSLPLSYALDSIGPIAPRVEDCARLDSVLANDLDPHFAPAPVKGLRLAIPEHYMLEGLDTTVARAFERATAALREAGALVESVPMPELTELSELLTGGGFTAAESYHIHRHWLTEQGDAYDPRVRSRIQRGAKITAADYLELQHQRRLQMVRMDHRLAEFDALIAPTVSVVPPRLCELQADEDYARINLVMLRNASVGNLLDLCSISLPCHCDDELPVGFMMLARSGADRRLLRQAAGVEQVFTSMRGLYN